MRVTSEWSKTEAGREVQVSWVCIYEWRKARRRITGYPDWQCLCCNASFALFGCHKTRIVKKAKALNFQNSFCPHSHLWSWILGKDRKTAITSASARNKVLSEELKELHYLTRCVALRFKNLLTSSHYFSELKDLSLDGLAM